MEQNPKFTTFGKNTLAQSLESLNPQSNPYQKIFHKFSDDGHSMTKQQFKLAFIYSFGVKPSKGDIEVVRQFCSYVGHPPNHDTQSDINLNLAQF